MEPFLSKDDLESNNTRKKLLTLLKDPQKAILPQLELAAVVDWGVHFVKATYALEGDDVLAVDCFKIVETVRAAIRTAHIPNIKACVGRLCTAASYAEVEKKLINYANGCIEPGIQYFETTLSSNLSGTYALCKEARLFSPHKVKMIQPDAMDVDNLNVFPFLSSKAVLDKLKELPVYIVKSAECDSSVTCLEWWKSNESSLPAWSAAARKVFLLQPHQWRRNGFFRC